MTAHRAFRVPNILTRKTAPRFEGQKADAQKLREAKVVIIDEISMLNRDVLDFIDRTLRDLTPNNDPNRNLPFSGKTVVLGGDWKQLLPVVEGKHTTK